MELQIAVLIVMGMVVVIENMATLECIWRRQMERDRDGKRGRFRRFRSMTTGSTSGMMRNWRTMSLAVSMWLLMAMAVSLSMEEMVSFTVTLTLILTLSLSDSHSI